MKVLETDVRLVTRACPRHGKSGTLHRAPKGAHRKNWEPGHLWKDTICGRWRKKNLLSSKKTWELRALELPTRWLFVRTDFELSRYMVFNLATKFNIFSMKFAPFIINFIKNCSIFNKLKLTLLMYWNCDDDCVLGSEKTPHIHKESCNLTKITVVQNMNWATKKCRVNASVVICRLVVPILELSQSYSNSVFLLLWTFNWSITFIASLSERLSIW